LVNSSVPLWNYAEGTKIKAGPIMMKTMFQYPDADLDSIGLVDQDPDLDAESGSRQADFVLKKEKNEEF
jgi:hypothetical protein